MDSSELPQWQSHKVVRAGKVEAVHVERRGAAARWSWIVDGARLMATPELMARVPAGINPVGGYLVRYEDGFESWSPAKAFEEGYTKVEN